MTRAGRADKAQLVEFAGQVLPPSELRFCGLEFKDHAYYLKSARLEVARLVKHCGLTRASRVLDVGCGSGRLAIGILVELPGIERYTGLDVHRPSVDWCLQNLQARHPALRFVQLDVMNERYNPTGSDISAGVSLPVDDASVDVINLYSVFSHMTYGDVVHYLAALRRAIAPTGRMFLTAFVEDEVPNFSINPAHYREEWDGALHCVRFERTFFEDMLREAGFRLIELVHGRETNGQSALYVAPEA
ncbi:MAG TPA: class I SAM-dependent methyltransferase [Polyangiaceae bacterium]|nr:class I SAM-dependent methyltransferase [Polyangiaceae bacterium]